jgi:hypothetical protein
MKKLLITLVVCLATTMAFADTVFTEGFEYANHDLGIPIGWTCNDSSWRCGYLEKDHNRIAHTGNWYAFSDTDDAWMYMPFTLFSRMQYRFSCWAISDGDCQLEFWAGTEASPESMHTLLLSTLVSGSPYEKCSSYVDTIPAGCQYIAIHAITGNGANYLTIDDIEIEMVEQYTFEAMEISGDTAMYPGTEASFRFLIHNTGYDPLDVTVHPSDEYFTNFSFYYNGVMATTFVLQPDETIEVTVHTTLRPEVEPGTVIWLDIRMTIPCNCNTALVTFWVTPLDATAVSENGSSVSLFPNPTTDFITVEAEGLQQVDVFDATGRMIKSVSVSENSLQLDLTGLKQGVYFISARTRSTSSFVKSILKM